MRLRRAGRSRRPRRSTASRRTDLKPARRSRGGRSDAGQSTSPPPLAISTRTERSQQPRQPGAGPCATVPAAQLMGAMLGQDHADRRQLAHLVAAEPPGRTALLIIKPAPASATRIRIVIDDLIHLVLRLEITTRTLVPRLPARLATLALPAHQLLGLRTRLRPPLRARLGRIARRRHRTRARILPGLRLQSL